MIILLGNFLLTHGNTFLFNIKISVKIHKFKCKLNNVLGEIQTDGDKVTAPPFSLFRKLKEMIGMSVSVQRQ